MRKQTRQNKEREREKQTNGGVKSEKRDDGSSSELLINNYKVMVVCQCAELPRHFYFSRVFGEERTNKKKYL